MPYIKKTCKAGKTIEVTKTYSYRYGRKIERNENVNPTPDDVKEVNKRKAETRLRRLINANYQEGDYHVTLTYDKDKRPDIKESKEIIKEFLKELRKLYKKANSELKYIFVTEYKNKAIHHHVILNDLNHVNIPKVVRKLWEKGKPKFSVLDDTGQYKDLAEYLIKETDKTFREKENGICQRWTSSRNLIRPEEHVEIISRAEYWKKEPKTVKGYYIDKNSVYEGINEVTGYYYQRYTMIRQEYEEDDFFNPLDLLGQT